MAKQTRSTRGRKAKVKTMKRRKANATTMKRRTRLGFMKRKRITRKVGKRGGEFNKYVLEDAVEAADNKRFKNSCKSESDDCKDVIDAVKEKIRLNYTNTIFYEFIEKEEEDFNKIIKDAIFNQPTSYWDETNEKWILPPKPFDDDTSNVVNNIISQLSKYYGLKYIVENPTDEDVIKYTNMLRSRDELNKQLDEHLTNDTLKNDDISIYNTALRNLRDSINGYNREILQKLHLISQKEPPSKNYENPVYDIGAAAEEEDYDNE